MKTALLLGLIIVALVILVFKWRRTDEYTQQTTDKGTIIIYGSKTCGWCQKQEAYMKDKGIPYTFVDCKDGGCPEGITAFPTISINGEMSTGYKEM
jgi:glutaredoxin